VSKGSQKGSKKETLYTKISISYKKHFKVTSTEEVLLLRDVFKKNLGSDY
jgi:hypothetical protein